MYFVFERAHERKNVVTNCIGHATAPTIHLHQFTQLKLVKHSRSLQMNFRCALFNGAPFLLCIVILICFKWYQKQIKIQSSRVFFANCLAEKYYSNNFWFVNVFHAIKYLLIFVIQWCSKMRNHFRNGV